MMDTRRGSSQVEWTIFCSKGTSSTTTDAARKSALSDRNSTTVYVTTYSMHLVARNNIFARGSASGLQDRCGGVVENNLFVANSNQLNWSWYGGNADLVRAA